ncbi:hypothetical protein A2U01_0102544, partial [Trifolium medium]|nr:hypothetical protein [Trifolium medium]
RGAGAEGIAVVALKKRKRELELDIGTNIFKLINRNRLLGVMVKYQRGLLTRLDEACWSVFEETLPRA